MTQAELLRYLVEVLESLGVEYMIGGSQASMYYGIEHDSPGDGDCRSRREWTRTSRGRKT